MVRRLASFIIGAVAAATAAGALVVATGRAADEEKSVLADLISRALSTPATRVVVGRIEGALSSDATVHGIEISDRDGVWLKLDRARIVWRRLALVRRRLEIDALEVNRLEIMRTPVPAETRVVGEDEPLLPELPVKVEIKRFNLAELNVGQPILGTAARISATGAANLGSASEGLDLRLEVRRLDQPGTLTARLGLVPEGQRLSLNLRLDEPAGGVLARAADIPGLPPVKLDLNGDGTLDAFQARLAFDAGAAIGANGNATLSRTGPVRRTRPRPRGADFGSAAARRCTDLLGDNTAPRERRVLGRGFGCDSRRCAGRDSSPGRHQRVDQLARCCRSSHQREQRAYRRERRCRRGHPPPRF